MAGGSAKRVGVLVFVLIGVTTVAGPVRAATFNIAERDNVFDPRRHTVNPGDTVVWTNVGGNPHTATADPGQAVFFDSGTKSPGQSFSFTFNAPPGQYRFYCQLHGQPGGIGMAGIITVAGDGSTTTTTTTTPPGSQTTVSPTTAETSSPITASATGAQPGVAYQLRFGNSNDPARCPTGNVIGGPTTANASGQVPNTQGIVPPSATPGQRHVCFTDNTDPTIFLKPTPINVI